MPGTNGRAPPVGDFARSDEVRGRVKGLAFREFLVWYRNVHGDDSLRTAIARVPVEDGWSLMPGSSGMLGVLPSMWYESDRVGRLVNAILAQHPASQRDAIISDGANAIMRGTLRGAYKLLFRLLATPEGYVRFVDRLWRTYHDDGQVIATWHGRERLEVTIHHWGGHHPALCRLSILATPHVFTEMGMRSAHVHSSECISTGGVACRAILDFVRPC